MRIWTFQHPEFSGTCLWTQADQDLVDAYRWLADRMEARGLHAASSWQAPVWFWPTRPDLRHRANWFTQPQRLIEADVPDAEVLLSNLSSWHAVLNRGYLGLNEADDTAHEKASPAEIERSWERIFPDHPEYASLDPEWWGKGILQGTTWEIPPRRWISHRILPPRLQHQHIRCPHCDCEMGDSFALNASAQHIDARLKQLLGYHRPHCKAA